MSIFSQSFLRIDVRFTLEPLQRFSVRDFKPYCNRMKVSWAIVGIYILQMVSILPVCSNWLFMGHIFLGNVFFFTFVACIVKFYSLLFFDTRRNIVISNLRRFCVDIYMLNILKMNDILNLRPALYVDVSFPFWFKLDNW